MIDFIPMINVGDNHSSAGDWNSLVGVSVDNIDLLVAIGRKGHGEAPSILREKWRLFKF